MLPVTTGNPPVTMPAEKPTAPTRIFQVAPTTRDCLFYLPQTPHSAGMVVAMADGAVRQLSPSIAPSAFWGAVTPAKGETLGSEW